MGFTRDVCIIGGCGHAGLPLGIALADRGRTVSLYDTNDDAVARVSDGQMPFVEPGAPEALARVAGTRLLASADPAVVTEAEHVIVVVGTPIDEHLNPDPQAVPDAIEALAGHLRDGQILILRSTLYPGVTALVEDLIARLGLAIDVAFCPERIAEGKAMAELYELPQIVAARHPHAQERAEQLFHTLTDSVVPLEPEEAELAKLFTNAWRYSKFAVANQFFMIANDFGLDYERIRSALAFEYPRAADLPAAGFAAGPCLFKDTMQLAAFNNNNFVLGHASMMVNEGLPLYVVSRIEHRFKLANLTVGILGMAFKGESDDPRSSLSYKLRRILRFKAHEVLCTDPYVGDPTLLALEEVLERSDLVVVATPHVEYQTTPIDCPVIDIWGIRGQGVRV